MSIQSAYDQWSSTYDQDRNLTRDLDQEKTRLALLGRHYGNTLELGCGTGKNTQWLVEVSDSVHALDFSEGMIASARKKVAAKNVEFAKADLTQPWPVASDGHDLIVCNLVLEHIHDLEFIFAEAYRTLRKGGRFYVSELHPFRQYLGGKAHFQQEGKVTEVPAHVHHVSEFLHAAANNHLVLQRCDEYWHSEDEGKPPRLAVFMFKKE